MKSYLITLVAMVLYSCSPKKDCSNADVEQLMVIEMRDSWGVYYEHTIILDGFDRACLDSIKIMEILSNYNDTLSAGKPIMIARIFNSKKRFDMGESLSQPKEIDKDCLLDVKFDADNKPVEFRFYDRYGNEFYTGSNWKY